MAESWVEVPCAACGEKAATPLLEIPHAEAPQGRSFLVACRGCGLRRLQPRPGPDVIGRYYAAASGYNAFVGRRRGARAQRAWDFLRDGFSAPAGHSLAGRVLRPLTRRLAAWQFDINVPLDGRQGLRVLEVGSGYGDILIYLQSRGCRVLGVDLSAEGAAKGREYGVEIRVGNLADLALPSASFDVAILCHSLEHVPDPNVELGELARLLVPGGRVHIAVPNGDAVRLALDGVDFCHLSHPLHFWFYDAATLVRLLARHGFQPVAPPQTTTRHHALMGWKHELSHRGVTAATRRLARFLQATRKHPHGGDVLRVVAEKRPPRP